MKVKFNKLHPDAKLPVFATTGAAGADVFARLDAPIYVDHGQTVLVPLGFAMALPSPEPHISTRGGRWAAFLLPRSGIGHKNGIVLGNLVGLIDEDFRGEVCASVWNRNTDGLFPFRINPGDRIAQMVVQPVVQFEVEEVEELDDTERGAGGFGSTGVSKEGGAA